MRFQTRAGVPMLDWLRQPRPCAFRARGRQARRGLGRISGGASRLNMAASLIRLSDHFIEVSASIKTGRLSVSSCQAVTGRCVANKGLEVGVELALAGRPVLL